MHWQTDVLLVVGLRLGCLNHALLTAESIERHGLRLKGWVGNSIDPHFDRLNENLATLDARIRAPCLGLLRFDPHASLDDSARALKLDPVVQIACSSEESWNGTIRPQSRQIAWW